MKYAADFRELARNALRGKWGIAVIVGLVAVLLGGAGNEGPEINLNIEGGNANLGFEIAGQTIFSTGGGLNSDIGAFLAGSAIYIMLTALVIAAIHLFLGSVVGVGYSRFNLELIDHNDAGFEHLFKYFPWWANAVCTRLLKGLYVFLWFYNLNESIGHFRLAGKICNAEGRTTYAEGNQQAQKHQSPHGIL